MIDNHLRTSSKIKYDDITKEIPTQGRGIYAAWLKEDNKHACVYIGKASNLHKRIKNHYSGQRGSDQFCLYIFDSYVKITIDGIGAHLSKEMNRLTREWSRENITFSYIEFTDDDIDESEEERYFRRSWKPILNPL